MTARWRDPRGVAATIVLFPIFVAVTFSFVQGVYWQLDRQVAAAEAVAVAQMESAGIRDVSVSVSRGADLTTVSVSGTSPGIIAGTSVHVSARSVTPSEGVRQR